MVVRCTRRMLGLLGKSIDIVELPVSDEDWYANLLWLERRKCLLLTHAGTLFSVFLPYVRVSQLRPLGPKVVDVVEAALRAEELSVDSLGTLHPDELKVAKTASRSVLGFMNDMAVHIDYAVASAGGLGRCDAGAISRHLRRIPYNRLGYLYPIDLVVERVQAAPVRAFHSPFAYSERKRRPE